MTIIHTSLTRYLHRAAFEDTPNTLYFFGVSWDYLPTVFLAGEWLLSLDLGNTAIPVLQTAYQDGRLWFNEFKQAGATADYRASEEARFAEMVDKLCDLNGVPRLPRETIKNRGLYHDACRNIPTMEGWFLKVGLNALVV